MTAAGTDVEGGRVPGAGGPDPARPNPDPAAALRSSVPAGGPTHDGHRPGPAGRAKWVGLVVVAVALALRAAEFPRPGEIRDMDELPYTTGGLQMAEGVAPNSKASPAALVTRVGWAYALGRAGTLLLTDPEVRVVPSLLRPYHALDKALFQAYADLDGLHRSIVAAQLPLAAWAAWGAFRLMQRRGGLAAGLVGGGLFATLPLLVHFAGTSLPYGDAWSFVVLALYAAGAWRGRRRWVGAGVFYGLAVASRVDAVLLGPLLLWELWARPAEAGEPRAQLLPLVGKVAAAALATTLLAAPWTQTHLVGNLRMMAVTRSGVGAAGGLSMAQTFVGVAWGQGLGVALALLAAVPFLAPRGQRAAAGLLFACVAALVGTAFAGRVSELRYHGMAILAVALYAGVPAGMLAAGRRRWVAAAVVAACVAVPAGQALATVAADRAAFADERATAWLERRVPPGTIVYFANHSWTTRPPLPTEAAADATWADLTDGRSWRRKLARGMERFGVPPAAYPRALSEDNLVIERSDARRFFVLGGRQAAEPRPRFDVRVCRKGPTFGVQDVPAAFAATGGVVLWADPGVPPPPELGSPVVRFTAPGSPQATYVFCSPDVAARLAPP